MRTRASARRHAAGDDLNAGANVVAARRKILKPLKWFCCPQFFRYEKQQRGRLREFYQFNADIIGESSPAADAEMIALAIGSHARA